MQQITPDPYRPNDNVERVSLKEFLDVLREQRFDPSIGMYFDHTETDGGLYNGTDLHFYYDTEEGDIDARKYIKTVIEGVSVSLSKTSRRYTGVDDYEKTDLYDVWFHSGMDAKTVLTWLELYKHKRHHVRKVGVTVGFGNDSKWMTGNGTHAPDRDNPFHGEYITFKMYHSDDTTTETSVKNNYDMPPEKAPGKAMTRMAEWAGK